MRTKIIIGCILILLAILQATALDYLKVFNIKPDALLVAIIIVSLFLEWKWVLIFSSLAGALKDIFAALPLGLNTLIFVLLASAVFKLSKKIIIETNYAIISTVFVSAVLLNLIAGILCVFLGIDITLGAFLRATIIGSLYTTLLSPLIIRLVRLSGIDSTIQL